MSRDICICLDFLNEGHRAKIRQTAEALGFTPHFFREDQLEEAAACLQTCEIYYGYTPELLRTAPAGLKWFCCAYAGVDPYCKDESLFADPSCLLSNSNCYGVTIAEHILMVLLMLLRQMPRYSEIMGRRGWENNLPIRSIHGSSFTLLGTGDIGSETAKRLRSLGADRVIGVSRSGRSHPAFDEVFPISRLDEVLPRTELLIMALPETPETMGILSRERIALLPEGAYVVNVGRGSAVDQAALAEALNGGRLAGAALDVCVPEPLPEDHFLWDAKNLILTPHCSGNLTLGYTCDRNVELFLTDLANYAAGRPLNGLVDRRRGY